MLVVISRILYYCAYIYRVCPRIHDRNIHERIAGLALQMTGSLVATALLLSTGLSVVKGQNSKESEPSNDGCIYRMWEGVQGSSIEAMMRDPMFLDRGGAPDVEEALPHVGQT